MGKYFMVAKREGRHGLDFIIESRVTGEVFLILLDSPDSRFPLIYEVRNIFRHIREVREWVRSGVIKFAGKQVVYCKVYI